MKPSAFANRTAVVGIGQTDIRTTKHANAMPQVAIGNERVGPPQTPSPPTPSSTAAAGKRRRRRRPAHRYQALPGQGLQPSLPGQGRQPPKNAQLIHLRIAGLVHAIVVAVVAVVNGRCR
jgi:hypothetical protein